MDYELWTIWVILYQRFVSMFGIFWKLTTELKKAEFKIQLKRRVTEVLNTLYFEPQSREENYQNCSDDKETRFLCLLHNDLIIDRNDSIWNEFSFIEHAACSMHYMLHVKCIICKNLMDISYQDIYHIYVTYSLCILY